MEKDMTRKGFLAAAAAVGAAALVPSVAMAEGPDGSEATPLTALDVEPVEGAEALSGSEWAERAVPQIDVVKSHSGVHIMNEPAYFAFSGWDTKYDQPADVGFGFSRDRFFVKCGSMELVAGGVYGELADFVVEAGTSGSWSYRKWASGAAECWIRRTYDVPASAWSPSSFYPQGYSASGDYCARIDYPFAFSAPPCETFSMLGVEGGWCEVFAHPTLPNSATTSGFYQVYRTALPEARTIRIGYSLSVRGTLA